MFCSNCGHEITDDAKFCPACGNKNEQPIPLASPIPPVPPPVSFWQAAPPHPYQDPYPQKPAGRGPNKKLLILVIAIAAVLIIGGIIATVLLLRQRGDEAEKEKQTTTTEASVRQTTETTTRKTQETTTEATAETTTEPAVTETTTVPTQTQPPALQPGVVPDSIWMKLDPAAALADYRGTYGGNLQVTASNLEQIPAFQTGAFAEQVAKFNSASGVDFYTDVIIDEEYLDCYSEHPTADEDGYFMSIYPLSIVEGTYFEEYIDPEFVPGEVEMRRVVTAVFYQNPDGQKGLYILYYQEYIHQNVIGVIETRVDCLLKPDTVAGN